MQKRRVFWKCFKPYLNESADLSNIQGSTQTFSCSCWKNINFGYCLTVVITHSLLLTTVHIDNLQKRTKTSLRRQHFAKNRLLFPSNFTHFLMPEIDTGISKNDYATNQVHLRLNWGSVNGSYCSNIKLGVLAWALFLCFCLCFSIRCLNRAALPWTYRHQSYSVNVVNK
jgi:hypothetical protein